MSTDSALPLAPSEGKEVFVPTPENISDAIKRVDGLDNHVEAKEALRNYNQERIVAMLQSAQGQQELVELLVSHQDVFQEAGVDINPESLQSQVGAIAATLEDIENYYRLVKEAEGLTEEAGKAAENVEENPGMFRRALRAVGGFAKAHPIVTIALASALVIAVTGAGVAAGFYFASGIEGLLAKVGLSHLYGSEGAAVAIEEGGRIVTGGSGTAEKIAEGLQGGSTAAEGL